MNVSAVGSAKKALALLICMLIVTVSIPNSVQLAHAFTVSNVVENQYYEGESVGLQIFQNYETFYPSFFNVPNVDVRRNCPSDLSGSKRCIIHLDNLGDNKYIVGECKFELSIPMGHYWFPEQNPSNEYDNIGDCHEESKTHSESIDPAMSIEYSGNSMSKNGEIIYINPGESFQIKTSIDIQDSSKVEKVFFNIIGKDTSGSTISTYESSTCGDTFTFCSVPITNPTPNIVKYDYEFKLEFVDDANHDGRFFSKTIDNFITVSDSAPPASGGTGRRVVITHSPTVDEDPINFGFEVHGPDEIDVVHAFYFNKNEDKWISCAHDDITSQQITSYSSSNLVIDSACNWNNFDTTKGWFINWVTNLGPTAENYYAGRGGELFTLNSGLAPQGIGIPFGAAGISGGTPVTGIPRTGNIESRITNPPPDAHIDASSFEVTVEDYINGELTTGDDDMTCFYVTKPWQKDYTSKRGRTCSSTFTVMNGPGLDCEYGHVCDVIVTSQWGREASNPDERVYIIDPQDGTTGGGTTGNNFIDIQTTELPPSIGQFGVIAEAVALEEGAKLTYLAIEVLNGPKTGTVAVQQSTVGMPSMRAEWIEKQVQQIGMASTYVVRARDNKGHEVVTEPSTLVLSGNAATDSAAFLQCNTMCGSYGGYGSIGGYGGGSYGGYGNVRGGGNQQQGSTISFGYCSANSVMPPEVQLQMAAMGGMISPPRPIGQIGCNYGEQCWCVYSNIEQGIAALTSECNPINLKNPPNIWNDPSKLERPSELPSSPPSYACHVATKASATAELSTELVETGDKLTISGAVGKIATECNGYTYDCRQQRVLDCELDEGFFKTELKYSNCPSGFTSIHEEGAKKYTNWGRMLQLLGIICDVAKAAALSGILGGGGEEAAGDAAGDTAGTGGEIIDSPLDLPAGDLPIGVPYEPPQNYAKGIEPKVVKMSMPTGKAAQAAIIVAIVACNVIKSAGNIACSLPRNAPECFRVCAKDIETDPAPSYVGSCGVTQAQYVIGETEATFGCPPSSEGVCEGFPNKRVDIEIKDLSGNRKKKTQVITDANGNFEYIFRVPQIEGRYNAIITIPEA
ncbi:hypothetical protein ACFLQN_02760 [Candidatus Aenigmatarchaeota archaeon]